MISSNLAAMALLQSASVRTWSAARTRKLASLMGSVSNAFRRSCRACSFFRRYEQYRKLLRRRQHSHGEMLRGHLRLEKG